MIPLEGLGETLDPTLAFADEDARRRAELDAAIAAEDAARRHATYEVTCSGCGDVFRAHNKRRTTCVRCSSNGGRHAAFRRSPTRKRRVSP